MRIIVFLDNINVDKGSALKKLVKLYTASDVLTTFNHFQVVAQDLNVPFHDSKQTRSFSDGWEMQQRRGNPRAGFAERIEVHGMQP